MGIRQVRGLDNHNVAVGAVRPLYFMFLRMDKVIRGLCRSESVAAVGTSGSQ